MFSFQTKYQDGKARAGVLQLKHGEINTPVFMPCGTKGTVKSLDPADLEKLGVEIILGNTYHLYMRPGDDLIARKGGLNKWISWNKPILTDSGGFQVFSLGQEDAGLDVKAPHITEDGVTFYSHLDGSKHFISPEIAMQIQNNLGSDIMMAFDECAPADSSQTYAREAMQRTHAWLNRCIQEHGRLKEQNPDIGVLFPIIQGVTYDDLRIESAQFVSSLDLPGIAIGGLSVGESKEIMYHILDVLNPYLPELKPRYLMGVGTPEDLINGVERGIDMFDCVLPTRFARHGSFWSKFGRNNIRNEKYKESDDVMDKDCLCYACQNFSLSYIRHLFVEKEILAIRLMSIHNIHFLMILMKNIREAIKNKQFQNFKKEFFENYTY